MSYPPEIDAAFAGRPDLRKRIHAAIGESPNHASLFRDVSTFVLELTGGRSTVVTATGAPDAAAEPAAKKRKLDGAQNGTAAGSLWADPAAPVDWQNRDTSFSVPQRKKLVLQLVATTANGHGGIRAVNPTTGSVEFGVSWSEIEQVFCLPIPERAKRAHNFVVIPRNGDGVNPVPEGVTAPEPLVWSYEEPTGKALKEGEDPSPAPIAARLNEHLVQHGKQVIFPTKDEFVSELVQSHRKDENAFHVKAHRGSKDGFLFFTSVGIIWGFKKPLAFFSFATITSVSYTSVLQRTFNLNINTGPIPDRGGSAKGQEIEFAMLDQADYAGIDAYIKKHELNDASMAAQRRAQRYNVNGPSSTTKAGDASAGAAAAGAGAGLEEEDEESELQKAERLLQDEEDELEEDYDPGSEGESEGSGSDSEDEEEYDVEGHGEEGNAMEYDEDGEEYDEEEDEAA